VYECNLFVDCHTLKLGSWFETHSAGWISGPSPQ